MRRSLFAATSIIALATAPAFSQDGGGEEEEEVTIDDTREEQVETATVNDGGRANLIIGSEGRVQLRGGRGPAVRVNSNNNFTMDAGSRVEVLDVDENGDPLEDGASDGAVVVQVDPGVEGDIDIGGVISAVDSYLATNDEGEVDSDGDGEPDVDDPEADGPFARDLNKTGLLIGAVDDEFNALPDQEALTGNVFLRSSGTISVAGQDSYGLRTVTDVTGDILLDGGVSMRGERSRAISIEGNVGGDVSVASVRLSGPEGEGVYLGGDVGGGFRMIGTIEVSGYRISQRLSAAFIRQFEDEDLQNAGSAVVIAGNIVDGVFVAASSNVRYLSSGGAAIDIGQGGETITLGPVALPDDYLAAEGEEDEDEDREQFNHGFINQGSILANGIYDGRGTTAFLVGGFDEDGLLRAVILGGEGFLNENIIEAVAFDAEAIGARFGAGTQADTIANTGTIQSRLQVGELDDGLGDDDPETEDVDESIRGTGRSVALQLDANSDIRRILNDQGNIFAFAQRGVGSDAVVTAVVVNSDALEVIENTGSISASFFAVAPSDLEDETGPRFVAIDASNHTTGLVIRQTQALNDDGESTGVEPLINGDIILGSGDDLLDLQAGTVDGSVEFGAGADRLVLNNASITGGITDSDGDLTIDVTNGTITLTGNDSLNLRDAIFREGGVLQIEVNAFDREAAFVNASGDLVFEAGSDLNIALDNLVGEGATLTLISANNLDFADESIIDTTQSPFLYNAEVTRAEDDENTLILTLTRRTADELGMNSAQAAAYDEAFAAFQSIEALGAAFAGVQTAEDFFGGYNQLLPEYAASAIQFALANNDAAAGALSARLRNARLAPDELAGIWAQEFGYFADRAGTTFGPGYRGQGVGLAVGIDRPLGPFYAVGLSLVGSASEIEDTTGFDEPMVALSGQVGTYAALDLGGIDVSGSLALGYDRFEIERNILLGDFSSTNTAEWSGWHIAGSAVAGRDFSAGQWTVRPEASLTWLTLFESGYTESVEDPANATLALIVDDRESTSISAAATVNVARRFGSRGSWWAPHLRAGYRGEFDDTSAETIAQFGETGSPFTLRSETLPGSGFLLGLGLSAGSDYSTFTFAYDADVRDEFVRHVARLVIRLTF